MDSAAPGSIHVEGSCAFEFRSVNGSTGTLSNLGFPSIGTSLKKMKTRHALSAS